MEMEITKTKRIIRQNRLEKYARILSRRYSLNVNLEHMRNIGCTNATNKILISARIDNDEFKNLILQKAVILHEIGHVMYTDSSLWMQQAIDKSIVNIIEDGRGEERVSREYPKARLYFIYLNQNILNFDIKKWEKAIEENRERVVLDFLLREAKKTTGTPQLPLECKNKIKYILQDNYNKLIDLVNKSVFTEDKTELYSCVDSIDSIMNNLFARNTWGSRDNVAKTNTTSIKKCGSSSKKMKDPTKSDEKLLEELLKELEKQSEKLKVTPESKTESKTETIETTTTKEVEKEVEVDNDSGETTKMPSTEDIEKTNDPTDSNGILDKINKKLENDSVSDLKEENNLIKSDDVRSDFSDYGEIETIKDLYTNNSPISTKNLDKTSQKIAHLFKAIAETGDGWIHNQTRGRLEMHKISSIMSGNSRPRVFKKQDKVKKVDLSVCILVDCSSSMVTNYRYVKAMKSSYIISKALELGGYKSEVVGFFGTSKWKNKLAIKSFNQKICYAEKNFVPFYNRTTPLYPCLEGAEKSLFKQASKRKMIIVITDGVPNRREDCKQKIKQLEAKGIIVVGILIDTDDYHDIFLQNHRIRNDNLEQLPVQMTEVIKKVLLTIRR